MSLTVLNQILQDWVGIHRKALQETHGRLRAVAGDNVISTHTAPDLAVDFLLRLDELVETYNREPKIHRREIAYSAVMSQGDLVVPDFGVAGPLVAGAFRALGTLPEGVSAITPGIFAALGRNQERFVEGGSVLGEGQEGAVLLLHGSG